MKLIVGLGNIGDKYCFTRHNAGFMVADKFAILNNSEFKSEPKLKCFLTKFKSDDKDYMIIKPTTFMNLSGESVIAVMNYYKIDKKDLLVIYDDLSLPLGKIRYRSDGSDGGHNGIKSIIKHLGGNDFARLKIGIGPQPPIPAENFVLGNFSKEELEKLKPVLNTAIESINFYFDNGIQKTQNMYN